MKLTQIRNATLVLEYAGKKFLIDPMLAEKEAWDGFAGNARSHLRNPMVALPVAIEELLAVDAVIITHTHTDHWDEAAQQSIPKDMPIYTQNESDAALVRSQGFQHVRVLDGENRFVDGLVIFKTDGQHGSNELYADPLWGDLLGDACGLVFTHPDEKTLYIAGDTVWVKPYARSLQRFQPDIVVLNTGYAINDTYGPIIMGKEDTRRTLQMLPAAIVVASHMESINHCLLTRAELRAYSLEQGIEDRVIIPEDGESMIF
ncbi:MBL fold metallo-hydrolase [Serratia ficaria]|uniref:Metal-dependent hydrolase n=1 Tax=Serratia ficaria TaxID=61651 RepID=A0A240C0M6_SERFI|nr:MBL fold metallo-hydrolase [Serratia ficaria]MEE4482245.1 MBL fold metallo-hydrolase [Serratia ficaria]REF44729.1 L-ascorbate metabolism protein UlaG (beta-lactamase superfamily) [Serratia ficaria]CAI0698732.1 metal-dependent hydrolase [Serratia ficaria]CAI0816522.1 metal-dependent hydrolase [Serratia ficaria]CAI0823127.1 metal-dependent hydrolase [Serratia ficaria]